MEKRNIQNPKLTENDKKVLKKILDYNKIPDSEIAKKIKISPQAVFKIREKLENYGIIKGYMPVIDFKKIGINVMSILVINLTSKLWKSFKDFDISNKIARSSCIMDAYRVSYEEASHILVLAFKDISHKEKYIQDLQTKFSDEVHIKSTYTFSVDKIITHGQQNVLQEVLDNKEFSSKDLFLDKIV